MAKTVDVDAIRREVDPLWDINPLEVSCSVAEAADILQRVGHYLENESSDQPFAPILRPITQTLTSARFGMFDFSVPSSPAQIGEIVVRKMGAGCELTFELTRRESENNFRGVYRVVRNALMRDNVLLAEAQGTSVTSPATSHSHHESEHKSDTPRVEDHVAGRLMGTSGDLTFYEVRDIVRRVRARQSMGGKVPAIYAEMNIEPEAPKSFGIDSLRRWLRDPRFKD